MFCLHAPGARAQTFVNNTCRASSTSAVASESCTLPNSVTIGARIVAFIHTTTAGLYTNVALTQGPSITDSVNTGQSGQVFTQICAQDWNPILGKPSAQGDFALVFEEVATSATAPTITFTPFSSAPVDMIVTEIDSARRDVCEFSGAGDSSTATLSTGTLYPAASSDLMIVYSFENGASVGLLTAGSGYAVPTNGSSTTSAAIIETKASVTSGATGTVANSSTGHTFGILAVGYAAGGTTPLVSVKPQALFNGGNYAVPVPTGGTCAATAGSMSSLQSCVNSAPCNSIVTLVAGSTYSGTLQLPHKGCSGQWVLVESTAAASLSGRNTRISTGNSPPTSATLANMAEIQSSGGTSLTIECVQTSPSCDHIWFYGIILDPISTSSYTYEIVSLDPFYVSAGTFPTVVVTADHIVLDHCYIHGWWPGGTSTASPVRRGVGLGGTNLAVIDSDIRNIVTFDGVDGQAVSGTEGGGPLLIQNNLLSADAENILFGGASPNYANGMTTDVTIKGNYTWKDPQWHTNFSGNTIAIKNLMEMKEVQRMQADGNVYQNNWTGAQAGTAILTNPGFSNFNGSPFLGVFDYTFTNNWVDSTGGCITLGKGDYQNPPSMGTVRAFIENNLCSNVGTTYVGSNSYYLAAFTSNTAIQGESADIVFDHNTALGTEPFLEIGSGANTGTIAAFTMSNDLGQCTSQSDYCLSGSGTGSPALVNGAPNATWANNAIMTYSPSNQGSTPPTGFSGNTFALGAPSTVGFTNLTSCNTIGAMPPLTACQLTSASTLHNAGNDLFGICGGGAADVGVCNWTTLNTDAVNVIAGMFGGAHPPAPVLPPLNLSISAQ